MRRYFKVLGMTVVSLVALLAFAAVVGGIIMALAWLLGLVFTYAGQIAGAAAVFVVAVLICGTFVFLVEKDIGN